MALIILIVLYFSKNAINGLWDFRAVGILVPANADVPRILVVPCGRFGRKTR